MARRGGRGGRASSGRSSGGRSSSSSRGRSSSRSSSKRSSSTSSRRSTSSGRSSSKGRATTSKSRTRTTRSAPAKKAAKSTSKATPRRVTRTVVRTKTVSPPKAKKPAFTSGAISVKKKTPAQQQAAFMSGTGTPVTVTFASGQKQTMKLSTAAIRYYQNQGLKVSTIQQTYGGINPMQTIFSFGQPTINTYNPSPNIPRIQDESPPWTENPPKQLHVSQDIKKAVKPKRISAFGGLGANPWNPIELLGGDIRGLFGESTTKNPQSQYLPQQLNTQSTGYPTYTAMAQGQYQEQAYEESPRGFQTSMLGDSSFQPMDTIKNLMSNQWVIIGGLALVVLIVLKFLLGGRGGGSRGGGGGTKIYT